MEIHSINYSIPYFIVCIISLCLAILAQRTSRNQGFYYVLSIILLFFLGLRGYVLTDFMNYRPFFDNLSTIFNLTSEELLKYEPGFVIYSSLFKTFIDDYFIWVFFNTLIDVLVLNYIFKKYSISVYLSWFFFFVYMGILMEFNLFRNMKAIDLFLLSLPYIQNRQFLKFFTINFIGAIIHSSALLFLPTYFFIARRISKTLVISVFILTNIVYLFQFFPTSYILDVIRSINPMLEFLKYGNSPEQVYGISLGYIERTLMYIFCFIYYEKLARLNKSNLLFCNSFFCYYILFHLFADIPTFTSRIPLLFIFSYWVIIPNLMGLIRSSYRSSWYALIILFGLYKLVLGTSSIVYKYDNVLFGIETFQKRVNNTYNEWNNQ